MPTPTGFALPRYARPFTRLLAGLAMVLAGPLAVPLASAAPNAPAHAPGGNWAATITVTPDGSHIIGNPKAKLRLTEYMSYTCPHCAHFAAEATVPLELGLVASGKGSFEIRHLLRDPIDMTVALLTNCVPTSHFLAAHQAFLASQTKWMTIAMGLTEAQRQRWGQGEIPQRMRAIASDLHFYDMMEQQGLSRAQTDRCLSDKVKMDLLSAQTAKATQGGVEGTPSFAIDGVLLAGTHDWASLQPQLNARL